MSQGPAVNNSPVEIGDIIEVKIEKILPNGKGVAHLSTKRLYEIFVEVAKEDKINVGDTVRVYIDKLMPSFASGMKI